MDLLPIVPPVTVLLALGGGIALMALPLLARRVPPNRFYGIRIAAAFRSTEDWYAINAFGARRFLRLAAALVAMGLALGAYPQAPFWLPIACLFATLFLLLATVRSIGTHARTLNGHSPADAGDGR